MNDTVKPMTPGEIKDFLESEVLPINPDDGSVEHTLEMPELTIKWHPDYTTKVIS